MQKILLLLNNHPLVDHFTYNSPTTGDDLTFYEMEIYFTDGSELHVKEILKPDERKYSYHWQNKFKELIIRWDTAKHHPQLSSYPHHKHDPDPSSSEEITLEDVLTKIFEELKRGSK